MRPLSGRRLPRVLVIGGGEIGSAVTHRLVRAGMLVFVADRELPTCIRRGVCFAAAPQAGRKEIEGVAAVRSASIEEALEAAAGGAVPVVAVREGEVDYWEIAAQLEAEVVVDARMLKRNQGALKQVAALVIGLGPGFLAPRDVDAVVETNRGHDLGRVIYDGGAEPDTGTPAKVCGYGDERVVRAPADGLFTAGLSIGRSVCRGEKLGMVGEHCAVEASIDGLVRGLVADGTQVRRGQKIGDIDPRGEAIDPFTISDKGRAVAGGVLEAIMTWWVRSDARV